MCPRIAYHDSGSGGGNGGGDGSSEAGVYKRCMWDTVGINALNRAIVERIDCCKQLRMMKEDLAKRGRGFEDVILLDTLEDYDIRGAYDPQTKIYSVWSYDQIGNTISEEFVHMFQDNVYVGGIRQYGYDPAMRQCGCTNIEFEAKFINDMNVFDAICGGATLGWGDEYGRQYADWVGILNAKLTNGTLSYSDIEQGYQGIHYEDFMRDFATRQVDESKYNLNQIKPGMMPEVLIYLLTNSTSN